MQNPQGLRSTLQAQLRDILGEVTTDQSAYSSSPTIPPARALPAYPRTEMFGSRTSPNWTNANASLAQSLGIGMMTPTTYLQQMQQQMALNSDALLLSAAASQESALYDQVRNAVFWQNIAQEKTRLVQQSYVAFLKQQWQAQQTSAAQALAATVPMKQPRLEAVCPAASSLSVVPEAQHKLCALGNSRRLPSDPYIDVSHLVDPTAKSTKGKARRARGGVSEPFPEKLYRMLMDIEKEGKTEIVSFYSHGRAFAIHDMDSFVYEIMPKYFKQSRLASFARQLNLYGFLRISTGPDTGGYYHELFLQGRPSLLHHMRRVGVPQGQDRRKFRPKQIAADPDFYSMKVIQAEKEDAT